MCQNSLPSKLFLTVFYCNNDIMDVGADAAMNINSNKIMGYCSSQYSVRKKKSNLLLSKYINLFAFIPA